MNRRTLLGIASFVATLPLLLPLAQIVNILASEDPVLGGGVAAVFIGAYLVGLGTLITLIVLYAIDAFRNPRLSEGWRVAWLVLLITVGVGAVPTYWWRHVRGRDA